MGHVHVMRGNITKLACDAWLLPTDGEMTVEQGWFDALPPAMQGAFSPCVVDDRKAWRLTRPAPVGWDAEHVRAMAVPGWSDGPRPWLVNVGGDDDTLIVWYLDGVRAFIAEALRAAAPSSGVATLALPTVGTGRGGAQDRKAEVLKTLLRGLLKEARERSVDIVLVTRSAEDLAAAQHARRSLGADAWPGDPASASVLERARALAGLARQGKLAVFMGAGISLSAGMPSWKGLLRELGEKAKLSPGELDALEPLDARDSAQFVQNRLRKEPIQALVAARTSGVAHHSLEHALVAALPVEGFVTTNYDQLFELAAREVGPSGSDGSLSVLIYDPKEQSDRWLLKLHGCASHPADIVLVRTDYARYGERRGALLGLVQAMLLTRHLLFVGFSLTDENFHDVADVVRRAQPLGATREYGTALMFHDPGPLRSLWEGEIDLVVTQQVRLFLDHLAFHSETGVGHFFDPAFDGLFTDQERALRRQLATLRDRFRPTLGDSPVWSSIEAMLEKLGSPRD